MHNAAISVVAGADVVHIKLPSEPTVSFAVPVGTCLEEGHK